MKSLRQHRYTHNTSMHRLALSKITSQNSSLHKDLSNTPIHGFFSNRISDVSSFGLLLRQNLFTERFSLLSGCGKMSIATKTIPSTLLKWQFPLPKAFEGKSLFINGEFVNSSSEEVMDLYNPSNGAPFLQLPSANALDVQQALEAAREAFPYWAALTASKRAAYLYKLGDLVKQNMDRLVRLETFDCGKPLRESRVDMEDVVTCLHTNAAYAEKFEINRESVIEKEGSQYRYRMYYEPYGVVGLITPWNYPLLMAMQKVAAALAAGCTCVLKPSEYAVLSCIEFAELCKEANLPNGVFNLVVGYGHSTGNALVKNPIPRKISFTGSVPTGQTIMRNAADTVKPVHLELGGKSPMIVFDDVNLKATIDWILTGIFWGSGQVCSATSRLLAHRKIYEQLCEGLKAATDNLTVGSDTEETTYDVGPLISKQQHEKVKFYLEIAKKEGLTILAGAESPEKRNVPSEGYFIRPTIYKDVPTDSKLWREEIFGPVLVMRSFATEEEAIEEANNTEYGLAAAVMTADDTRRDRILKKLEAGFVWGNCSQPVGQDLPFGGYKMSGFGRECGAEGFKEYLQLKTIVECPADHLENTFLRSSSNTKSSDKGVN